MLSFLLSSSFSLSQVDRLLREVVSILSVAERLPVSKTSLSGISPTSFLHSPSPPPSSLHGEEILGLDNAVLEEAFSGNGRNSGNDEEDDGSLIVREPLGSRVIDLTRYGDLECVQNVDIQCYQFTVSVGCQ